MPAKTISAALKKLCIEASQNLGADVVAALKQAQEKEKSAIGRRILDEIVRNVRVAADDKLPLCQDTGCAVVFLDIGQQVLISGDVHAAVNEGIAEGYKYLRKSMVRNGFQRINTQNNTPAMLHIDLVAGDKIKIGLLPKGAGAENCSFQKMFLPTATREEVQDFIVAGIKEKAAAACPPLIVGIGIGGSFDHSAYLAKKALLRKVGQPNPDQRTAALEKELLKRINKLGIGPMGLGGSTTALAVQVLEFPCHIASLPVAVNLECHSHRYREVVI